jgi:hypothetical protein
MKSTKFIGFCFLMFLLGTLTSYAESRKEIDINEMIEVSKVSAHLRSMEEKKAILASIGSSITGINDANDLEKLLAGVFEMDLMMSEVRRYLRKEYDANKASKSLLMFRRELPSKMLKLEAEAAKPENKGKFKSYLRSLNQQQGLESRIPLISHLDQLTHSTDWMSSFLDALAISLIPATNDMVASKQITQAEQAQLITSLKAQAKEYRASQPGSLFLLYAYKSTSEEELEEYIEILESEEGQWFMNITRESLIEAVKPSIVGFGNNFKNVL